MATADPLIAERYQATCHSTTRHTTAPLLPMDAGRAHAPGAPKVSALHWWKGEGGRFRFARSGAACYGSGDSVPRHPEFANEPAPRRQYAVAPRIRQAGLDRLVPDRPP